MATFICQNLSHIILKKPQHILGRDYKWNMFCSSPMYVIINKTLGWDNLRKAALKEKWIIFHVPIVQDNKIFFKKVGLGFLVFFLFCKKGYCVRKIFLVERIMKYWNILPAEIGVSPTPGILKMTKNTLDKSAPRLTTAQLEIIHLPANSVILWFLVRIYTSVPSRVVPPI